MFEPDCKSPIVAVEMEEYVPGRQQEDRQVTWEGGREGGRERGREEEREEEREGRREGGGKESDSLLETCE